MTMEPWLRQHLIDTGKLGRDGITRKAQLRSCHRCRAPVIVGLDHEPCGYPVTTDPTHLDQTAELIAILLGRRTYDLTGTPNLNPRNHWRIKGDRKYPVLPSHQCRTGVPLRIHDDVLAALKLRPKTALPEEAPF